MYSKATITNAKVTGSEYGRESTLTLTLDLKLPTPTEVRTINEWAASDLDWETRQSIAQAQRRRHGAKPPKLSKAQKSAQAKAHEEGAGCGVDGCATCNEDATEQALSCLAHNVPLLECPECDEESAISLDPQDVAKLHDGYQRYVEQQNATNQEAFAAAHEAALFLMLIKKPVQVSIAPAQQSFADLLQLRPAPIN